MARMRGAAIAATACLLVLSAGAGADTLADAAARGDMPAVRALLNRANANEPGSEGTPRVDRNQPHPLRISWR